MNSTFGARLKAQRERQQVSLASIAERTKIKLSLLEALERDDVTHWPQGIFGRSYLRTYAQAVGMDPDATVREFAQCHPLEPTEPPLSELREKTAERGDRWPPTRLQVLIDSAIDAFHTRRAESNPKTVASASPAASAPTPEALPREVAPAEEPAPGVNFTQVAELCTRLGCTVEAHELTAALEDAAGVFNAVGLILWIPNTRGVVLSCAFAHGYPDELIAQLPSVPADSHNAIAKAFRTRSTCVVYRSVSENGAIVAPLLTPEGCAGVLSLELRDGAEAHDDVRAAVTILAAQVSTLMGFSVLAHTRSA